MGMGVLSRKNTHPHCFSREWGQPIGHVQTEEQANLQRS